jgi:hypothetical protein
MLALSLADRDARVTASSNPNHGERFFEKIRRVKQHDHDPIRVDPIMILRFVPGHQTAT